MITDFEKEMLEKSLKFLKVTKTDPIDLGKLQQIINHASEEFDSIENVKFKFLVENPEDKNKIIFGITKMSIIPEVNMICFRTNKSLGVPKKIDEKTFEAQINENEVYTLESIQKIIDSFKNEENWSTTLVNIENLYVPNMYAFLGNSVCIKLGEN